MIPAPILTKLLTYLPTFVKLFEVIRDMIRKRSSAVDERFKALEDRVSDLELRLTLAEEDQPDPSQEALPLFEDNAD